MVVPLAMFGWIPVVLAIFASLPPRRAVLVCFITGWLFLPMAAYRFEGFPDYNKESATSMVVFLAALLFDGAKVLSFRPRLTDLPIALWCLCPLATSISNDLGVYDGFSTSLKVIVSWALPYVIGRIYFTDLAALRELAIGIFIGGLIYLPFCLWEIRMSPRLHLIVYGFRQHAFGQTVKMGGYRPMVFMQHGLMVGMWMACATLLGAWLWSTGAVKRLRGIEMRWLVAGMAVTTVLCKSMAAIGFLTIGWGALWVSRHTRTRFAVVFLLVAPLVYMSARSIGGWDGWVMVDFGHMLGEQQGESIETRIVSENHFFDKAKHRLTFGWGGHSRIVVTDEKGRRIAIPDGMWVIALAERGFVGLTLLTATLLTPAVVMLRRFPYRYWSHPETAPAVAIGVMMLLYMLDCLPNAMINPIFMLAGGGLCAQAAWRGPRTHAPDNGGTPSRLRSRPALAGPVKPDARRMPTAVSGEAR